MVRASLEDLATSLTVQNRTPELLKKLKKMHEQMISAAQRGCSNTYHQINRKFHELIIDACGNPRLIQLIRNFDKQTIRYRMAGMSGPGWMKNSEKIHAATVASFESGDAEVAGNLRKEAILGQIPRFSEIFTDGEETT